MKSQGSDPPAKEAPPPAKEAARAVVKLEGVHKSFDGTAVLQGVDLAIYERETLVIIGRSGSGKSVTLKHIVGLLEPDRGKVLVFGKDVPALSRRELLEIRLKIGFLFQSGALINWLRIDENLALPLLEHGKGLSEEEINKRVEAKLKQVNLLDAAKKYPTEISGGMKKRAGLARALIFDPDIILYDEPTAGLDPVMASSINDLVINTQETLGVTQVVVTHDMESAFRIADRIAMLYQGKIIAEGSPDEIRQTTDPLVKQFITGSSTGPITEGS